MHSTLLLLFTLQPSENGGECQVGEFCPEGSAAPTNCTPGQYCDTSGLEAPVGECDPGWYCPSGSSSPRQMVCPQGYFCPLGTDLPEPCRNGTYGAADNLASAAECRDCDPGYFCNGTALTATTGPCDPGYYCPGGQSTPTPAEYVCWAGHQCVGANGLPERCDDGWYQNEEGQSDCKICPPGEAQHFIITQASVNKKLIF
jgi:hypothetical protein